jgi:ketol-acid reductoisomerase
MKKLIFICMGLALSAMAMATENEAAQKCPNGPKNNLTEIVLTHISEHGILTEQELADFTAIYRNLNQQKRTINKETRAIKKQLETCTDSKEMVTLMQQVANNDLKRAQLDKEALYLYIEKIDASRLAQVLQCSEKYKNEIFKNMRLKRQEMKQQAQ